MTIPIRSLPGFSDVSGFYDRYKFNQSRNRFSDALNSVIHIMMSEYNGYHADRAFKDFKNRFEQQKQKFENDPSTFSNLGFENFTKMIQIIARRMDPLNYAGRDAQFVYGLQKFGFEMRDVWETMPYDHQVVMDEHGVLFAGEKHVKAIDFVEGISRAVHPLQIPDLVTDACFFRQKSAELAPIFRRSNP
jgi:hypothetical protein